MKEYGLKALYQEDKLFANRINFLLVAESMLLVSYVTARFKDLEQVSWVIALLGIGFTVFLGFVNIRNNYYIYYMKKDIEKVITEYARVKNRWQKIPYPANPILSWGLTGLFLYVCLYFLILDVSDVLDISSDVNQFIVFFSYFFFLFMMFARIIDLRLIDC